MAEVEPLRALRYDLSEPGALGDLVAPPYDVLDAEARAALAARSPHNVVHVDLPEGEDPYAHAAELLEQWRAEGALVRDSEPALWALTQDYRGPDGATRTRHGLLARVRVEEYGPGRIRPHERTHPGPKEDRLRLTRATASNLSPIFSLYSDPGGEAWDAVAGALDAEPFGEATDADGTANRLWRVADRDAIAGVEDALRGAELLIADGHHRYETARAYAEEVGGEGPHRYVLMCLVALQDPGLTVFPTHRLVRGLRPEQHEQLADALRRDFEIAEIAPEDLAPGRLRAAGAGLHGLPLPPPFRLTPARPGARGRRARRALGGLPAPGHGGAGGRDPEGGAGDDRRRHRPSAGPWVLQGRRRGACAGRVRGVRRRLPDASHAHRAGPGGRRGRREHAPKSTYFFPKVPTGLLFNPLRDEA